MSFRLPLTLFLAACFSSEHCPGQVVSATPASATTGASATTPNAQRTVFRTSLASSGSIVGARRESSEGLQIRVTVQYLMVDEAIRRSIYEGLDREGIASALQIPTDADRVNLDEAPATCAALQQIHAPSRVTTYTLSQQEFADVLKKTVDSTTSELNVAPKIILLNGSEVEMTDFVQRPFVVGFQRDGEDLKPNLHVIDDGTRLRMVAHLTDRDAGPNQPIDLSCDLTIKRVLDVRTDQVFGMRDEPLSVQSPIQQITSAVASARLSAGQTLMIDPHVTSERSVETETGIPMFGKLPYVGRSFKKVARGTLQQHMLLLLQPTIESSAP